MQNIQPHANHALKFLHKSPERKFKIQKKCFPHHTYGVSKQAPLQFQKTHVLINPHGYAYQHQHKHATGTNEFHNYTQNKFFTVHHGEPEKHFSEQYKHDYHNTLKIFHKKRGLLSQYMQKNGWMTKVHKLMGHQRSPKARQLSNQNRTQKIKDLKKPPNSTEFQMTEVLIKPTDQTYFNEIPKIMSQKMKIRKKRNTFFQQIQSDKIKSQKKLSEPFYIESFSKKELTKELDIKMLTSRNKFMDNPYQDTKYNSTFNWRKSRALSTRGPITKQIKKKQVQQEEIYDYNFDDNEDQDQSPQIKMNQKS